MITNNDFFFDKTSIFYDYILAFLTAFVSMPAIFDKNYLTGIKENEIITIEGKIYKETHFYISSIIKIIYDKLENFSNLTEILAQQLLISCYGLVENKNDYSPEFEFFRHIRNGAAHGNHFKFERNEPRRFTKWKNFEIIKSLEGQKVIFGLIGLGDILLLLKDIENKL